MAFRTSLRLGQCVRHPGKNRKPEDKRLVVCFFMLETAVLKVTLISLVVNKIETNVKIGEKNSST